MSIISKYYETHPEKIQELFSFGFICSDCGWYVEYLFDVDEHCNHGHILVCPNEKEWIFGKQLRKRYEMRKSS